MSCGAISPPPCNSGQTNFSVTGNIHTSYDLYLVAADGDSATGISGVCFGIDYDGQPQSGLDIFSWISWGDSEYRGGATGVAWPSDGSGNLILWDHSHCKKTPASGDSDGDVSAILGVFYVYAYSTDVFSITKRDYAETPDFSAIGCSGKHADLAFPSHAGKVGFGTAGSDPCN